MSDSDQEQRRYPYFGVPPARQPRPASCVPTLRGKRVVLSTPEGFVYDMRAISELQRGPSGEEVVIVSEEDYYRWMFTHQPPRSKSFPAHLVWIE